MLASITSEFRKFFTTRLWWGMAIGMFVAAAAFALLFGITLTMGSSAPEGAQVPVGGPVQVANSVYTSGMGIGYLLMLTIGVLQIGSEYRHKTITSTFLATPRRPRQLVAKLIALLGIGAIYGIIALIGSVSVGATTLALRGHDAFPSTEILRTLALSLLVLGLWALIGFGIGVLIPNQVAALVIGIGVAWIVEPLAGLALSLIDFAKEHIVPFLPSQATSAVVDGVNMPDAVTLSWWAGLLTLAAWAIVLAGLGTWRAQRQDLT